ESAGYMCAPISHHAGRDKRGRKGDRLAMGIKMVVIEAERQIVIAMAKVSGISLALIGILRAVKIESLPGSLRICAYFEFFRHFCGDIDHPPNGIAGIGCRKG